MEKNCPKSSWKGSFGTVFKVKYNNIKVLIKLIYPINYDIKCIMGKVNYVGDRMKEKALKTIRNYNLIDKGDQIVIGVSGGPDSMVLLYLLLDIRKYIPFDVHVAHVNHGVRGKAAHEDEEFVKRICEDLNLSFYNIRVDMNKYAKDHNMTAEEAGRKLRYGFFREVLKKQGKGKIAVAHNRNDQAETLLMRFMRGTGIYGLKGIPYKRGNVIRPLLDISREEIEAYVEKNKIRTRLDKTNLEPIYNRNKIRLELIPYIEENFNPNIVETLARFSKLISIESDYLDELTSDFYLKVVKKRDKGSIILDRGKFNLLHKSMQQRIIRNAIEDIQGSLQGFTEKHINNIMSLFLEGDTGKTIHLIHNIIAKTSYMDLIIEKKKHLEVKDYSHRLNINGSTYVEELDCYLKTKVLSKEECEIDFSNRFIKYFDYDMMSNCLHVRNRRDGDRFNPIGMKGRKKLKDFFIDEKIPKEKRDLIPLIVNGEDIIWILGYRISNKYKVTEKTKNIIIIERQKI